MDMLGKIFYLILPILLGGLFNMIFVKLPIFNGLKVALDGGRVMGDGKRLFGDNKTVKGFIGMIVWTAFWFQIFYWLARYSPDASRLGLIAYNDFSASQALFYGAVWGFGYVLFELPNSCIKRRFDIPPGQNASGPIRFLFIFLDQADSVFGCMLTMLIFYQPDQLLLLMIFCIAVAVHFGMNILLYSLKLKKQYL